MKNAFETNREDKELLSSIVKDDNRAWKCRIFRFLSVAVIILAYFAYQLSKYSDAAGNTYSTSSLTKITDLDVPYMVFQAVSADITPYFEYVFLSTTKEFIFFTEMDLHRFDFVGDEALDSEYDINTDNWTLIKISKKNKKKIHYIWE